MSASPPSTEDLTFVGSRGHALVGTLHRPTGTARGSVLLAHCFTCSRDLVTMTRLARGLADAGFAAMRFDFTGLGESGGTLAESTVSANISDLTRAATALITMGFGPCGLIGHSLGGAASILAASRLKTVRSLVTIGAPASTAHVTRLFASQLPTLAEQGEATITIAGRSFNLDREFVDDLHTHDVLEAAASLGRPYCAVHARDDDIVGFENAESLHHAARDPKRLVALDTGGHLFVEREASEKMVDAVVAWFAETL